ncbi:MAG: RluA family pseudouridine synthase [Rubrivivax sp.]|jgi:tRNA pseudouridine32 synthase/23S rRNA pseudouridine746 synthase|nr:RluA family pseudouridine synthase [Rubrivivax sp.]
MSTPPCSSTPEESEPRVIALGLAWIVVDKPAGLPSVPGRGPELADCAVTRVQRRFPEALTVHRLDMATSGLLLLARGPLHQRSLSIAFEQRQVHKVYEAVVDGWMAQDAGVIDLPLAADWPRRPRQCVDTTRGKPSTTHYRVLERLHGSGDAPRTRVELQPRTGRSHQLRVHLLALGHPICGDTLYADNHPTAASARLMLHARDLALDDPCTGNRASFSCPTPF